MGGVIGFAAGGALCVLSDGTAPPGGTWLGWAGRFLSFGGLALIEGAAVGLAVAFALFRFLPGPGAQPPDDRDHTA